MYIPNTIIMLTIDILGVTIASTFFYFSVLSRLLVEQIGQSEPVCQKQETSNTPAKFYTKSL